MPECHPTPSPRASAQSPLQRPGPSSALGCGAVFGAAALVRRTKPLHPAGSVGEGTLEITAPQRELGVPLLADRGTHRCTVRWSRAMGLPDSLPDFEGLALRFEGGDGEPADLLFASTGTGAVSRFLLAPRSPGSHGPQTTLLPVQRAEGRR